VRISDGTHQDTNQKGKPMKQQGEHSIYEVRLVVAIPNYNGKKGNALDAIVPFIESDIVMLEFEQNELSLMPAKAEKTTARRAKRATVKTTNSHQRWTDQSIERVFNLLSAGKTPKQIGDELGRSQKAVELLIWKWSK